MFFTITMVFVVCCLMSTSLWAETVGNTTVFNATSTSNYRRADAGVGWSGGMPDPFGSSTQSNYIYSIYATYHRCGCD